MKLTINVDGGCAPNPGQMSYGMVVWHSGRVQFSESKQIGHGTCNIAEWRALLAALAYLRYQPTAGAATIRMDSRLVVEQATGRWKVKTTHFKPLRTEAATQLQLLRAAGWSVTIEWVPRDQNVDADALSR